MMARYPPYLKNTSYLHFISLALVLLFVTVRAANYRSSRHIRLTQNAFEFFTSAKQLTLRATGLTKDKCVTTADCIPPRTCTELSNATLSCTQGDCACFPPELRFCTSNLDCTAGEVCAISRSTVPVCQSAAFVDADPEFSEFFRANGTGLTYDTCAITVNCRPPRSCTPVGAPEGPDCTGNQKCLCRPPIVQYCSASSQCDDGERCTVAGNVAQCASPDLNLIDIEPPEWNSSLGLTGDFCRSNDECAGDRKCLSNRFEICQVEIPCTCVPSSRTHCARSTICEEGEVCAAADGEPPTCYSEKITQSRTDLKVVESSSGTGLLSDRCVSIGDCKPPRECVTSNLDRLCQPGRVCTCQPPGSVECNGNNDCNEIEICVILGTGTQVCLKKSIALESGLPQVDSNGSEANNTQAQGLTLPEIQRHCIARHLLNYLSKHELLFQDDVLANVLCDSLWNCATPGHIVLYKGESMMMKSYCSRVQCVARVMFVNSPRYKKRFRIKGSGDEIKFSALSAQYSTRAEEILLNFAIRIGL